MMTDWITIIGAALGGGAVTKAFDYLIVKERNQQSDEDRMVKLLTQDNALLRQERKEWEAEKKMLMEELIALKTDYALLQSRVAILEDKLKHYEQ